ncbi:hypothetical protein ACWEVY_02205, partial [Streptomyces longwoodensis]
ELKTKAQTFVNSVKDDDDWEYDGDKVDEHNQLRDDITATVAAFWAAERTCHNKITAIWNGTQMVAGDGSDRKDQYGFNAEDLKNAKLPWGDPVDEKHHWYEVGHWVKSFVWDGLIVDGVWGTIKGLGTLVGFGGWDAMGQAWKGLAQLATGLALASIPGVGTAFWLVPDDKLPSWIRDSRTAMKETGKALVAWDEWGKNPGRAAGAVTFNVLTTVFTGGAGGAAAGAGKAGAVAKVLSVAGKAGKVIDPMTYIAKGAGAGLSKIGDITKALKGVGNIEIPKLPETAIHLPEGTSVLPDGTVHLPEGAAVPAGLHELPGGGFKVPDDVPVVHEDALPVKAEGGEPTLYADGHGNIVDGQGKVLLDVDKPGTQDVVDRPAGPDSTGPAGADVPHVDSPAKVPAMAGAAPHTVDAGTHINLGDSLGDAGRVGEDVPVAPGVHAGGDIPNVHAGGDLPGGHVGDHLPGGHVGDHLPGGHVGDHLPGGTADHLPTGTAGSHVPTNSIDTHVPAGTADNAVPGTSTGDHAPHNGPDHTVSSSADTGLRPGGPGGPLSPSALDDLASRFGDDAVGDLGHAGDDLGDAGRAGDDADPSAHHTGEGSGTADDTRSARTPEEQQKIIEDQIHKANTDPDWFKEHYRSDGHRHSTELLDENGEPLPILAKDADGHWIARDSMPPKQPPARLAPEPIKTDSLTDTQTDHLDKVAKDRHVAAELTAAEKAVKADPADASLRDALADAQKEFDKHLPGTPNNSAIAERLGEEAARVHVIPQEFPRYEPVTLPKTPNGANMFDQLYKDPDGSYLIVEAKAPKSDLIWRQGTGPAQGWMVRQGTSEYVHTIIAEMVGRKAADVRIANDLLRAWKDGKLKYVLVKANENTGSYAGATLENFPIKYDLN